MKMRAFREVQVRRGSRLGARSAALTALLALSCAPMGGEHEANHHRESTTSTRKSGAPSAAPTPSSGSQGGSSSRSSVSTLGSGGARATTQDASIATSSGGASTVATGGSSAGGASTVATGGSSAGGASTVATGGTASQATVAPLEEVPEPNLLIAFLGDQGTTVDADRVLQLIKSEGAAAVVHSGDFDYTDNAADWDSRIDRNLGPDFPYFAIVGNHDAFAWDGPGGYGATIALRQARVPSMGCVGDPGVKAACAFRGVLLVQSCIGSSELAGHGDCTADSAEQTGYLRHTLATRKQLWAVCSWHKNQHDLQVGTKSDEVGWDAYRECQRGGAIINNAHEHSYSRTTGLSDLGNPAAYHGAFGLKDRLVVAPGKTFVFVSGLGGASHRTYDPSHDLDTWWASYSTADIWLKNGQLQPSTATYGATFIRFNVMGNPRLAWGYFKDVEGRVVDEFVITMPQ